MVPLISRLALCSSSESPDAPVHLNPSHSTPRCKYYSNNLKTSVFFKVKWIRQKQMPFPDPNPVGAPEPFFCPRASQGPALSCLGVFRRPGCRIAGAAALPSRQVCRRAAAQERADWEGPWEVAGTDAKADGKLVPVLRLPSPRSNSRSEARHWRSETFVGVQLCLAPPFPTQAVGATTPGVNTEAHFLQSVCRGPHHPQLPEFLNLLQKARMSSTQMTKQA